ncbi:protein kinase domain-containing protein [Blastopirellula marina]|uniref:Protein kinase domain-containing protein n=1 Tax=Blastopirellula marina TaxID=124 RepID=A0A2S8FLN2_9BACT|nr:protein kinase [Blastopirellula marina]PQO33076.1 hypothetical protein C5Y98_18245 [Blastopirellula marina]PTL43243.1 hypothetical protein C5Y97_18255 [Blastopirellula marina]
MTELSKLGPFALENRLGNDQNSHVFHGFHLKQKRQAVVCILPERYAENPRARRRLEKRSRQLMKLNHPNIVRYHGAGIDQGIPFFALDYVDGISLQQYLKQHGPLPWETVVAIGLQICAALSEAHHMNIHHLDVRPAHILLSGDGLKDPRKPLKVQITSFWADPRWRRSSLLLFPKDRQQYLSPEQFEDPQYVDDASDIFSLGCVLYEMITGKLPFDPLATGEERWKLPERPASLELDCPVWLDRVVMRMIEIMPDRRPADIDSVAAGLQESQDAVARGMSAIEHALAGNNGRESIIDIGIDRSEAEKLMHKPRYYEPSTLFNSRILLGLGVLVVIGLLVLAFRPLSDEELYARAEPLVDSRESLNWRVAEEKYLQPLVDRYPDSPLAEKAQRDIDMIQMARAEARLQNSLTQHEFKNEAEQHLASARSLEANGNHLGAWYQFDKMVQDLPESPEYRPYRLIAQREIERLEGLRLRKGDKVQTVSINEYITQADEISHLSGKEKEGREIYRRVHSLYQSYPDPVAKGAVDRATQALAQPVAIAKNKDGAAKSKTAQASEVQEVRKQPLKEEASEPVANPGEETVAEDERAATETEAAPMAVEQAESPMTEPGSEDVPDEPQPEMTRPPLFPDAPILPGDKAGQAQD